MQVPPFIARKTTRCERCNLRYPADESRCTHCGDLSDDEVEQLRLRGLSRNESYLRLGLIMLVIGAIVAGWLGIAVLAGY
jgi:hypothetical protein